MPVKGSGQFGPEVIVGSAEYAKRWREKNKEKSKTAQMKYKAKQREMVLAAKLAATDKISLEQALLEVRGRLEVKIKALNELHSEMRNLGEITSSYDDDLILPESRVEVFDDFAKEMNIPYHRAADIMVKFDTRGEWVEEAKKITEPYVPLVKE